MAYGDDREGGAPDGQTMTDDGVWDFERRYGWLLEKLVEIHASKRKRYTGGLDPLANYLETGRELSRLLQVPHPEAAEFIASRGALPAMLTRMREKFQRLLVMTSQDDFLDPGQGDEESITDTYLDIAIISLLCEIETWRLRERVQQGGIRPTGVNASPFTFKVGGDGCNTATPNPPEDD